MKKVIQHAFEWNPQTNQGFVDLRFEDNTTSRLAVDSAAELAAIAAILSQGQVAARSDGFLVSGWQ